MNRPVAIPKFVRSPRLDGKKIGVPRNFYFDDLDSDVDRSVRAAIETLRGLGASIVEIDVPDIAEFNTIARLILMAEASSVHDRRLEERRADFGEDVRTLLEAGRFILATDYLNAQRRRQELCSAFNRLLENVDVIVTPNNPITAAKIGQRFVMIGGKEEDARLATTRFMRALNLTGLPLLTVPCGFDSTGLPIGLQMIGGLFDEVALLEVGHAFQSATDWHTKTPPVVG